MRLQPGDRVADAAAWIDPHTLVANHVRAFWGYLKSASPQKIAAIHAQGIGFGAIAEFGADTALEGAASGATHGRTAVAQAKAVGYPQGQPIMCTHDTSAYTANVPAFFKAEHDVIRAAGYGFGGYMSKDVVDACRAAGCVIDVICAPAAWSWGHGRHPDADWWQAPSAVVPGSAQRWDLGVVKKTHDVWLPGTPVPPVQPPVIVHPLPILEEDDMPAIVCNAEPLYGLPPNMVKFKVGADFKLSHLTPTQWKALGSDEGVPLSNAELTELGTV